MWFAQTWHLFFSHQILLFHFLSHEKPASCRGCAVRSTPTSTDQVCWHSVQIINKCLFSCFNTWVEWKDTAPVCPRQFISDWLLYNHSSNPWERPFLFSVSIECDAYRWHLCGLMCQVSGHLWYMSRQMFRRPEDETCFPVSQPHKLNPYLSPCLAYLRLQHETNLNFNLHPEAKTWNLCVGEQRIV